MPLYEFVCSEGHKAEQIVPYDTKKAKCPKCGKTARREGVEVPARRNPAHGLQV
jgi:putative FmdB family regulatory protein